MNARQENKLSMYLTVQKVCRQHEKDWQHLTAALPMVAEFDRCIADIQQTLRRQSALLTGVSLDKSGLQKAMGEKAYTVAQAVVAFANVQRDTELAARLDRSFTDYTRGRDTVQKELAEQVLENARPLQAQLEAYGVTEAQLNELEAVVNAFADKIGAPRAAITGRREATQTLSGCFTNTDDLLNNRLDKVFEQLRATQFYKNYKAARRLVNNRGAVTPKPVAAPPSAENN
jgi:hypothetical protein